MFGVYYTGQSYPGQSGDLGSATLQIDDALHAHTAETPTLTQEFTLVVDDALHVHTAEEIVLNAILARIKPPQPFMALNPLHFSESPPEQPRMAHKRNVLVGVVQKAVTYPGAVDQEPKKLQASKLIPRTAHSKISPKISLSLPETPLVSVDREPVKPAQTEVVPRIKDAGNDKPLIKH